ncbi:unnamed protein product, partial [marine sediment metagenome]
MSGSYYLYFLGFPVEAVLVVLRVGYIVTESHLKPSIIKKGGETRVDDAHSGVSIP